MEKTIVFLETKKKRDFDVLIHDGGLVRKFPSEENDASPPRDLLQDLNESVSSELGYRFLKICAHLSTLTVSLGLR